MPIIKHQYQLSTAHTFSYYELSTSNKILHRTVTLALGITQELSQTNTNANTASHTVTETVQTTMTRAINA